MGGTVVKFATPLISAFVVLIVPHRDVGTMTNNEIQYEKLAWRVFFHSPKSKQTNLKKIYFYCRHILYIVYYQIVLERKNLV